jgi:hypothetical protein
MRGAAAALASLSLLGACTGSPPPTSRRGLRWAVSHPGPAAPFLLGPNTAGWFNTTRSVAGATAAVLVQPTVFGINASGMCTNAFPDLQRTGALKPYADKGIETIVSLFPWVGSLAKGDFAVSGGFMGPPNEGLNCTTSLAKNKSDPRSRTCITPDFLVRAALARKVEFAAELAASLRELHASGFSLDWEYFYGNNQSNAAALWGFVKNATTGVKIYPWITNGDGIDWSDCGPIHRCGEDFAYCWDYQPLLPFSDGLLNMGSYSATGAGFGVGKPRSIEPVRCTNRSAGVIMPSGHPKGRWCGLGGTVKDLLTHGATPAQLSPGIWMDDCGSDGSTTLQGWTQPRLEAFLDYAGGAGATTISLWSALTTQPKWITDNITNNVTHKTTKNWPHGHLEPWNTTFNPSKLRTCPWFVPTLLDWVARG